MKKDIKHRGDMIPPEGNSGANTPTDPSLEPVPPDHTEEGLDLTNEADRTLAGLLRVLGWQSNADRALSEEEADTILEIAANEPVSDEQRHRLREGVLRRRFGTTAVSGDPGGRSAAETPNTPGNVEIVSVGDGVGLRDRELGDGSQLPRGRSMADASAGDQVEKEQHLPSVPGGQSAGTKSLVAFLKDRSGLRLGGIANGLGLDAAFLVDVSEHASVVPMSARQEIARRVTTAWAVPAAATLATFDAAGVGAMQKAASRAASFEASTTTYEDIVRRSRLTDGEKPSGSISSSMRSTEAARSAGREERRRVGQTYAPEELRDRLIARLGDFKIDVIAVRSAQMEGSRAGINGESGVIKYDETLPLPEVVEGLAHELGHLLLHGRVMDQAVPLDPVLASAYADTGPAAIARYSPRMWEEVEASAFALEFRCPSDEVLAVWRAASQPTIDALASQFSVSSNVIRVQLANALHEVAVGGVADRDHTTKASRITLTDDQRRAAHFTGRPVLVDAGAGTGKTATLIGRIERLLEDMRVAPEKILVITFSNEAAQELADRVADRFEATTAKALTVSTFHGLGMEFLHLHGNSLGFNGDPNLVDEDAQAEIVYEILGRVPCSDPVLLRDPWGTAVRYVQHINHCKHTLITPEILDHAVRTDPAVGRAGSELVAVYDEYERVKSESEGVDFADLIMLPLRVLQTKTPVRDAWRARYPWVMVDEFQDVSRATSSLLRALCGPDNPPWVVGDARQAIYRFLGASPENVSNFGADFPDAEMFSLEVNYRSSEPIIAAANTLADLMAPPSKGSVTKHNWRRGSDIEPLGPEPVALAEATSDFAERTGVVQQVRSWIDNDGVPPGDIAVLARRHIDVRNTMLGLKAAGVKAQAAGLLTAEGAAGDMAAALVVADAPHAAFPRLAYALGRMSDAPEQINELARRMFTGEDQSGPLPDQIAAVQAKAEEEKFNGDGWVALTSFLFESSTYLKRVLDAADTAERAVTLIEIVSTLSLAATYRATHTGLAPRQARIGFAERLRVHLTETIPLPLAPKPRADAVRVMTCHAAKGLEFKCVLVAGQTVPRMPPKYPWLPSALRPGSSEDDEQADSLLFVGVTRAKRAVVISWPTHAGQGHQARDKKIVPLLESWRQQGRVPVRIWDAHGADETVAMGRPVWGFPEHGTLKASTLGDSVCPLLTYLETILGMRFPEEEVALYPRFFAAVRRALRQIVALANQMGRSVTESEVDSIVDAEWPLHRFNDHPHFDLYRSEALKIARGFAAAFSPGVVGSVMLEPELEVVGETRGPKLILDLVAYFREPSGRVVAIAFRPESYATKAKNGVLLWSKLATKRTSFVLAEANVGNTMAALYSGADRVMYSYTLQSQNKRDDSLGKEAAELADRYRALATGDFTAPVNPYRCDRCRARVSCPHWLGAL